MSGTLFSNDLSDGTPNVPNANSVSAYKYKQWIRARPLIAKAVDVVADTVVTIYSHGFITGTPIRFTSTGTIPSGVSAGTTYYVRKVSVDTFTIHTSEANAESGASPVDLQDSGTGTVTVTTYYTPFTKLYYWDFSVEEADQDATYLAWKEIQSFIEGAVSVAAGSAKVTISTVAGVVTIDIDEAELDVNNMNGGALPFIVQDGKLYVASLYVKSPDDNKYYKYHPRTDGSSYVEGEIVGPGQTPS